MNDVNYLMGRQRQADLIREAEHEREVRQALRTNKRANPTLNWMGQRFIGLGQHLVSLSGEKN